MAEDLPQKALTDVLLGNRPWRRPIWFMRQAGRYLPEYRVLREQAGSFLDLCYNPKLAAKVTVQPLARFDLDAAIIFADILVVPHAMGLGLQFNEGEGPLLDPVREISTVSRLKPLAESWQVAAICETIKLVKDTIFPSVTIIGFCGGPWTVACYAIEGKNSDWLRAKTAAYRREPWLVALIERLIDESVNYLSAQITAGAEVVQIFDSWAGELSEDLRDEFVIRPLTEITQRVNKRHPNIPVILFARGFGFDHCRLAEISSCSAVSLETGIPMAWAVDHLPRDVVIQGNLDPVSLIAGPVIAARAATRLASTVPRERHIFNLGHGIKLGTTPESVGAVVDAVRKWDARSVEP